MRHMLIDVSIAGVLVSLLLSCWWLAPGFALCAVLACREGDE